MAVSWLVFLGVYYGLLLPVSWWFPGGLLIVVIALVLVLVILVVVVILMLVHCLGICWHKLFLVWDGLLLVLKRSNSIRAVCPGLLEYAVYANLFEQP